MCVVSTNVWRARAVAGSATVVLFAFSAGSLFYIHSLPETYDSLLVCCSTVALGCERLVDVNIYIYCQLEETRSRALASESS